MKYVAFYLTLILIASCSDAFADWRAEGKVLFIAVGQINFPVVGPPTLDSIDIIGPTEIDEQSITHYMVRGTYSDLNTTNYTWEASWWDDHASGTVSSNGVLTFGNIDSEQIINLWASYGSITNTLPITVSGAPPVLQSVLLSGASSVGANDTEQYTLTGTYDDGAGTSNLTTVASWDKDNANTTISAGLLTVGSLTTNESVNVIASYDGKADTNTVTLVAGNQPPAFVGGTIVKPDTDENEAYTGQSIASDASDPEGDPMFFLKHSGPTWLTVAFNGTLSGTPDAGDVGTNTCIVRVDALGGYDLGTLQIVVTSNTAPAWAYTPYNVPNALEDVYYTYFPYYPATDPDPDTLTYTKISTNNPWLTVGSSDMSLIGTPTTVDAGTTNSWQIEVSDGYLAATNTLNIYVEPEPVATAATYPMFSTNSYPVPDWTGFDAFTPPVTSTNYSGAPAISEWGRQAAPGDTIPLTAEYLTVLYPAYDTNGVPSVTAPGAAFVPPADIANPYAGAPAISEWGRQADPGDTVPLTGEGL